MREINIEALCNNYQCIKKSCGKKVCAMVKADAYGHGIKKVCETLKKDADFFGVATIGEAITIRCVGAQNRILMVGKSEFCDLQKYQDNNVELSVFSFSQNMIYLLLLNKNE